MQTTRELAHDSWAEYLDALSKELLNARVSIEVLGAGSPPTVQAEHLSLRALAYDRRDDVFEVAVACSGPRRNSVLRHTVDHPERVAVDNHTMLAPMTIAVDGRDGLRTEIRIEREAESAG
jgi:Family of unknown function (DUF5335)